MARDQGACSARRNFCLTLAGVLVARGIAIAQGSTRIRRIGFLAAIAPPETPPDWPALRDLGWVEGVNLHVERRYANGQLETLPALAEELVRAKVELIATAGPNPTRAAMRATTAIPIVFSSGDPVGRGLVASLARPGGNVTGLSADAQGRELKSLSLLKEMLPAIRRVGRLETSSNPQFRLDRPEFEDACRSLGLESVIVEIDAANEIDGAMATLARQHVQALMVSADSFSLRYGSEIVGAAMKRRLPTLAEQPNFVRENGALASYSVSSAEFERRWASYIDRILRGAKPAELPVEQPTKFELVINLKTAKALGLTLPRSLLLRADDVIQ
jgi:putative ABC transport system substrate-binding protein